MIYLLIMKVTFGGWSNNLQLRLFQLLITLIAGVHNHLLILDNPDGVPRLLLHLHVAILVLTEMGHLIRVKRGLNQNVNGEINLGIQQNSAQK